MSHLKNALDELYAEREVIAEQHKKLSQRLAAVEQGIESLAHLLADSEASSVPTDLLPLADGDVPLWRHIEMSLHITGPSRPREIADRLLALGYETKSNDFTNVVGTNLRTFGSRFMKLEDGRWDVVRK